MPVPHCFDYCSSAMYLEIRKYEASRFVLLFKIVVYIQSPLWFHIIFRDFFSVFVNKNIMILIEIP